MRYAFSFFYSLTTHSSTCTTQVLEEFMFKYQEQMGMERLELPMPKPMPLSPLMRPAVLDPRAQGEEPAMPMTLTGSAHGDAGGAAGAAGDDERKQ